MNPPDDLLDKAKELTAEQARVERQDADQERLLTGEDPNSPYPEDASHWAGVYAELVGFKNDLLERLSEDRKVLSEAAMTELERDENLLRLELARLKLRLSFWQTRQEELARE
jgi:serine phosphatase RsbU (regulator of sigma subunit)